jgi:hypothetical protein
MVLLRKPKKSQKMNDNEWEKMDAKIVSVILLNLSDKVIHNVINGERIETIWHKLEFVYGEKFDE